jgi:hypothetical protein
MSSLLYVIGNYVVKFLSYKKRFAKMQPDVCGAIRKHGTKDVAV